MMTEADADKLMKQAKKLSEPSLLTMRLKGDWEQATPLYEKAAGLYRQAKSYEKARLAYEQAATGQERQGSPYHAAKSLEKAAEASAGLNAWEQVKDFYNRAAQAYAEASRSQAAADALMKCAKVLEPHQPKECCSLYLQAIEMLEDEGRGTTALDAFRQAIGDPGLPACMFAIPSVLRNQNYADGVRLLMRYAAACDAANTPSSLCRAYLGAIVVQLYAENATEAWQIYQDALGVEAFSRSDQAYAAEDLFNAYQSGDAQTVKKCISKQIFLDLDNQVGRLAKQLPKGDLQALANALGGKSFTPEDIDDEDLT